MAEFATTEGDPQRYKVFTRTQLAHDDPLQHTLDVPIALSVGKVLFCIGVRAEVSELALVPESELRSYA